MNQPLPRPGGPGFITLLDVSRDHLERPIRYFDRLGDTFETSLFGSSLIATRDPAVFEEVLVRQHQSFIKDRLTRGLSLLLGQGLLTSDREPWRKHRRIIAPHFRAGEIAAFLPAFREEAEREVASWSDGETLDVHGAMARLSMRIALRTLFGTDGRELADFERSMRDAMLFFLGVGGTGLTLPLSIPTGANRRFLRARQHLDDALRKILASASARQSGTSVLRSLLQARDGGELSEQQLVDEGLTMLVAGHETSALTLTYTLALLADHPAEQRAIQDELSGELPDSLDAFRRAIRLNNAVKESMRLYPASWAIGREATEDVDAAGFRIARGAQVFLYQWAAHRHPRWFDEPRKFLPARWTRELESALPRGLYSPFGGGPRVCVGNHFAIAEILSTLTALLRRFELEPLAPFSPRLVPAVTLRPRDPVLLRVRRRASRG